MSEDAFGWLIEYEQDLRDRGLSEEEITNALMEAIE